MKKTRVILFFSCRTVYLNCCVSGVRR